jgi:hypothetical protein
MMHQETEEKVMRNCVVSLATLALLTVPAFAERLRYTGYVCRVEASALDLAERIADLMPHESEDMAADALNKEWGGTACGRFLNIELVFDEKTAKVVRAPQGTLVMLRPVTLSTGETGWIGSTDGSFLTTDLFRDI